ncbi:MAG: hypothetical protein ACRD3G_22435 [Vicinamibacterales bacterium]
MFGIAIGLEAGSDEMVALGYIKNPSLLYYSFQTVAGLIVVCETVVVSAIVLRHTYDALRKAVKP